MEEIRRALEEIDRRDAGLSAFVEVWRKAASAARPDPSAELAGVPLAVKGRSGLRAHTARRLVAAGAVPVGATAVPGPGTPWRTWGLGAHGPTRNPWRSDRTPGGSSAGAAVAVATGMAALATGGDGAGSVRIPAAWCGVFGLKTSNGLLPSPDPSGLAAPGLLARTAADALAALHCLLGAPGPEPGTAPAPGAPLRAVWSADLGFADGVDPGVLAVAEAAVGRLESTGLLATTGPGPVLADPADAWRAVRGGRPEEARAVREGNDRVLDALFAAAEVLVTPTTPNRPHGHDGPGPDRYSTALTWAFNLSGHPAASIPAGFTPDGCPVGLQLVAPRGSDVSLVGRSVALQRVLTTLRP
ncbi:amidase [Streptomyces sp. NPDC047968]|uniref:amidase n=1 Tax=unclassified Streptomyces TaxID=2593676 RepID=UPI0034354F86